VQKVTFRDPDGNEFGFGGGLDGRAPGESADGSTPDASAAPEAG
jgi:hypothetical protein